MQNDKTVNIPEHLHQELDKYVKNSNFNSINDLVTFILQDYLDHQTTDNKNIGDDAEVLKRLEDLGYM